MAQPRPSPTPSTLPPRPSARHRSYVNRAGNVMEGDRARSFGPQDVSRYSNRPRSTIQAIMSAVQVVDRPGSAYIALRLVDGETGWSGRALVRKDKDMNWRVKQARQKLSVQFLYEKAAQVVDLRRESRGESVSLNEALGDE